MGMKNKYKTVHKPKPKIIPGKIHNKVTNLALSKVDDKIVEKENRPGTNKKTSGKITTKNMVKSPIKRTPTKNTIKSKENTIKKDRELTATELKHLLESQNIDIDKKSPDFIHGINTRTKSTNELLKRSISNAARNDINLKPGTLNNADGECLWESLNFNAQRACIKYKSKESARELKQRSLTKAQKDTEMKKLPFMPENTTAEQWTHIRKDRVYETDFGDYCLVFAARALKRNILIFNTTKNWCCSNNTDKSRGIRRGSLNRQQSPATSI